MKLLLVPPDHNMLLIKVKTFLQLNRSDSDSSVQVRKPQFPAGADGDTAGASSSSSGATFHRGSMERRSLRWKKMAAAASSAVVPSMRVKSKSSGATVRTSLDLELDRLVSKYFGNKQSTKY